MNRIPRFALANSVILLALTCAPAARASSTLPLSISEQIVAADAAFRGKVVGITTARGGDGLIYTRTLLRVDEVLKGTFPGIVAVEHRGGQVGSEQEFYGLAPKLISEGEYLLFVTRNSTGKLQCTQGHASAVRLVRINAEDSGLPEFASPGQQLLEEARAIIAAGNSGGGSDVTDQAGTVPIMPMLTTGMLGGINSRFLQPDRGEPIPYLIDAMSLPAGMTLSQATNAVQQALNAWSAVTSLKFKLESIGSFGQGADTIATTDEKLRIQLHDNYGRINSANVLGIGGRASSSVPTPSGWDLGGNVAGEEFHKSTRGYVVLEAGHTSMENLATFAEVLCHEIGHALNMAHSSEVPTTDLVLSNSIMYFQAHGDGRGATLGAYDPPIIRQVYPSNTVPHMPVAFPLHRVIDGTRTPSLPVNVAGINEVEIRGYDLQSPTLTLITNDQTGFSGAFSAVGNTIKYAANPGNFADTIRYDPNIEIGSSYSYRDLIYARLSDGTNASPYTMVRVISFRQDNTSPPDGLPNYWMVNYFGSATPAAGNLSRATDDADGDGLNNLQEYIAGTNPKDASSAQRITAFTGDSLEFQAKAFELYEILGSTNLTTWTRVAYAFPTYASLTVRTNLPQTNIVATVSNLPATSPQMFYRVIKVP